MATGLISYSPSDAAFNVSATRGRRSVRRATGSARLAPTASDLLFQMFGFAAFLLPVALGMLGWRWFRSRAIDSQCGHDRRATGCCCCRSLPCCRSCHFPEVRGAMPAGGLLGTVVSHGLQYRIQLLGSGAGGGRHPDRGAFHDHELFVQRRACVGQRAKRTDWKKWKSWEFCRRRQARWHAWREEREQDGCGGEVEERADCRAGSRWRRKSSAKRKSLNEPPKTIQLADESDVFKGKKEEEEEDEREEESGAQGADLCSNREKPRKGEESGAQRSRKTIRTTNLPRRPLLREGERSQKLDEDELKVRARAIEAKCQEFDVEGRVTQINPGPGGHDVRIQAGSGHQVQPHYRTDGRSVPGAAGGIDSDRAHPGQIHDRH